jgi:hypothetical protein
MSTPTSLPAGPIPTGVISEQLEDGRMQVSLPDGTPWAILSIADWDLMRERQRAQEPAPAPPTPTDP